MPRPPRLSLRRRLSALVREFFGEPVCCLLGHGRPVLADVEVRLRHAVPPSLERAGRRDVSTTLLERGVQCRRCGTRVGD